jgi:hypothetical protein
VLDRFGSKPANAQGLGHVLGDKPRITVLVGDDATDSKNVPLRVVVTA